MMTAMPTPAATFAIGDAVRITDGSCKDGRVGALVAAEPDSDGDYFVDLGERIFWPVSDGEFERVSE